jgi:hypothetical protein
MKNNNFNWTDGDAVSCRQGMYLRTLFGHYNVYNTDEGLSQITIYNSENRDGFVKLGVFPISIEAGMRLCEQHIIENQTP